MSEEERWWSELAELDARRIGLDHRLRQAEQRARYCRDAALVETARRDEAALLLELDRLMTRTRAVEGKLLLARKARSAE